MQRPKIACCFSSQVFLRAVANSRFSSQLGPTKMLQWSSLGHLWLQNTKKGLKYCHLLGCWKKSQYSKTDPFPFIHPWSFAWNNGSYMVPMSLVEMFAPVQNKQTFWGRVRSKCILTWRYPTCFSCFFVPSHLSPSTATITSIITTTPSSRRSFCASAWSWPKVGDLYHCNEWWFKPNEAKLGKSIELAYELPRSFHLHLWIGQNRANTQTLVVWRPPRTWPLAQEIPSFIITITITITITIIIIIIIILIIISLGSSAWWISHNWELKHRALQSHGAKVFRNNVVLVRQLYTTLFPKETSPMPIRRCCQGASFCFP